MSCFKSGKSGRNFGRNFCPNPVNPVPAGFENSKSGAPLLYGFCGKTTCLSPSTETGSSPIHGFPLTK